VVLERIMMTKKCWY